MANNYLNERAPWQSKANASFVILKVCDESKRKKMKKEVSLDTLYKTRLNKLK